MAKTVFEKIIDGELPGHFVYKDEISVAFMDIHPLNQGHVLVVPRTAKARFTELDPGTAGHLFVVAREILAAILKTDLPCQGANLFLSDGEIAGQEVPHVHLHIVPRFKGDGIKLSFGKTAPTESDAKLDLAARAIASRLNRRS